MATETHINQQTPNEDDPQTIAVAGATGMIGSHLVHALLARGDRVIALVRSPEKAVFPSSVEIRQWAATDPVAPLTDADAVVNLVGQPIMAEPWTDARKQALTETRVGAVESVVEGIRQADGTIHTFLSASAIEYSGDTGECEVDETSRPGSGFPAELSQRWEAPTLKAEDLGVRVAIMRNGFVLGREGGMFPSMLPQFKYGFGGRYGSGQQWWSWIHVDDAVRLIIHVLDHNGLSGPINFVSPTPVRNHTFVEKFARVLNRPAVIPLPTPVLQMIFSGGRAELLTASHRVLPQKALDTGFEFSYPSVDVALADLVSTGAQATRFDGEMVIKDTAPNNRDGRIAVRARTEEKRDGRIVFQHQTDAIGINFLTMEEHLEPYHSGPPAHIHPYQNEQFTVKSGKLSVVMDAEEQVFGSDETVVVPRGTAHTFSNTGDTRVEFTTELHPALRSKEFFETIQRLEATGELSEKGVPKNLLVGASLLREFHQEWQPVHPSQVVQRIVVPVAARIAELLGYHLPSVLDNPQ